MPTHRQMKIWLACETEGDREPLEEFQVEQDPNDERVVNCWVASEAGKRFVVHYKSLSLETEYKIDYLVDGLQLNSLVAKKENPASLCKGVSYEDDVLGHVVRPFSFSTITLSGRQLCSSMPYVYSFALSGLVDDDSLLEQPSNAAELGTISIRVFRVVTWPSIRPSYVKKVDVYSGPLHETSKKVCEHRVTLGDAIPQSAPSHSSWEHYDLQNPGPYMIFNFRYRPRSVLQAQGIIPSDPGELHSTIQGQQLHKKRKRRDEAQVSSSHGRPNAGASSSSNRRASSTQENSTPEIIVVKNEAMRNQEVEGDDEATLSALERQLETTQQTIANIRRRKRIKRGSSVKPEQINLSITDDGVIDLTLD
ncbi:hypothetical protein DFH11DRAFT_362606 [Phellopilus nigrolimitatus]|nr:hypothetical protein DFH11DRAFT_362606 [Phellopilus nigrolimitatus]